MTPTSRTGVGIAVALVLATAPVALAAAGKATGGVKFTTGSGDPAQVEFNARSTDGTEASGRVHRRQWLPNGTLRRAYIGSVTCYDQQGDVARFSGTITNFQGTQADEDALNGDYFVYAVRDGDPTGEPDLIRAERSHTPIDCRTSTLVPARPVDKGNLTVH